MPRFDKPSSILLALMIVGLAVVPASLETEAHKPITSPYTYNTDILPILRDNCGRCHVEGGPAPMGLLTWNDGPNSARPWAESIRQLIVDEQMPPWYADSRGPAVKGGLALSPSESNKLLTWATGGTPEGDPDKKPARVIFQPHWSGGPPDLELPVESAYTMAASQSQETKEFLISTGLREQRWVRAADLLPGASEIVRNASISLEDGTVLSMWVPGDGLVSAPAGTAFRLPAGAKLRLQIQYKKQWQNEGKTITDRSTVGLYFAKSAASLREIRTLAVDAPKNGDSKNAAPKDAPPKDAKTRGNTTTFGKALPAKARVLAVRPSLDGVYGTFTVDAITPTGAKISLLKLRAPRPEWQRRYWLAEPREIPAGSRIEVTTTPPSAYIDLTGAPSAKTYPLQAVIEFVR